MFMYEYPFFPDDDELDYFLDDFEGDAHDF